MNPTHALTRLALVLFSLSPLLSPLPASSTPLPDASSAAMLSRIETARYSAVAARGPRGGVAVARPAYRPAYRPAPVPVRRAAWVRPPSYWWRPGTAVAAGAAIGFVTAAAATAYAAPAPPAPGNCWYYTNPQRTQGFWDACPK